MIDFIITVLGLVFLSIASVYFLFSLYSVFRPQRYPADQSNRINKLILIWFVLTREDLFVGILPFLGKDLLENFTDED